MQNTRLDRFFGLTVSQLEGWLQNPLHQLASHTIGLLAGFAIGIGIATYTGQKGTWDLPVAALLVGIIELMSWYFYRPGIRSALGAVLHTTKIGLTYNLILEAFKLGS